MFQNTPLLQGLVGEAMPTKNAGAHPGAGGAKRPPVRAATFAFLIIVAAASAAASPEASEERSEQTSERTSSTNAASVEALRGRLLQQLRENPMRELPGTEEALFLQVNELASTSEGRELLSNDSLAAEVASKAMAIGFLETVASSFRLELPKLPLVCTDISTKLDDTISYLKTRNIVVRGKRWSSKALDGLKSFGKALRNTGPVSVAAKFLGWKEDEVRQELDQESLFRLIGLIEKEVTAPLGQFAAILEVDRQRASSSTSKQYKAVLDKLKEVGKAIDTCIAFALLEIYRSGEGKRSRIFPVEAVDKALSRKSTATSTEGPHTVHESEQEEDD
ncbi:hypothetical protein CSUI_008818 [Cystoisospora suis]|uniref:Uncharacterized protein n=1 Tax=Cystoisospora suis TaxID=483139 RepID=A0A2C6JL36_9APIC|nr:hypothetical protein CSUI_008818 [Cystoisospora suis]